MKTMKKRILTLVIAITIATTPTQAALTHVYPDTFTTKVVRVHDGDTLTVEIPSLPPVFGHEISVRVYGVDTPEMHGPNVAGALKSRDFTLSLCQVGSQALLTNVRRDKYFRILADVTCQSKDLGAELLKAGLARPYFGGTK